MTRRILAVLALLTVGFARPSAAGGGLERSWIVYDSASGEFSNPEHWTDGFELGSPSALDTAIFDLPTLYTVAFGVDQVTDRVLLRSGTVTFVLQDQGYTLLNPLSNTSSVIVGELNGDSASLAITGGTLHGQFTDVGRAAGSFGALAVTGPQTLLVNDWQLRVGNEGSGLFEVSGGAAAVNGTAYVAAAGGSFGDALVAGEGSSWDVGGTLIAGKAGYGVLSITGGADVTCDRGIIAEVEGSFGGVVVSGTGSSWTVLDTLDVGMLGPGSLVIAGGATVTNSTFATVGTLPLVEPIGEYGGIGEVVVTGEGSLWTVDGDLYIGFISAGRWTLSAGGRVEVDGDLFRGLWLSDGTPQMVIELSGPGDYETPAVTVTGQAEAFDATVALVGGYEPQAGDEFAVITALPIVGLFTFDLPPLPFGLTWKIDHTAGWVTLRVAKLADLNGDGVVGVDDMLEMFVQWGPCQGNPVPCPADLNDDGTVGVDDFLLLLATWG